MWKVDTCIGLALFSIYCVVYTYVHRIMEDQLTEEKQRSAMLEVEANELKEHLKESEMRQKTRMDEIEKYIQY